LLVGTVDEKIGVRPVPAIELPVTVPEPLRNPLLAVEIVIVALCPVVRPVTVSGSDDPTGDPETTWPIFVFITKSYKLS
jgi:hypothetical protein